MLPLISKPKVQLCYGCTNEPQEARENSSVLVAGPRSTLAKQIRVRQPSSLQTRSLKLLGHQCQPLATFLAMRLHLVTSSPAGFNTIHPVENTHKLMGLYMEVLILYRRYTLVHGFCFFKLFPIGCIGFK